MDMYQHGRSEYSQSQGKYIYISRKITFSNITVTNDNHGLSGPNARSIIQDSFGNIWIGNYRGGVDFISYAQPLFNTIAYTIEKQGKINNKQVWGLWADNHQIWLGGEGELGIYEKERKQKTSLYTNAGCTHKHISM